jgi:oligopeptide/dipeptide ABC transporter ATP-binding protein
MDAPVLDVRNLSISMAGLPVVDGIGFAIGAGEALGLVGESGCGKSVTALALMRLLPEPPGRITGGRIQIGDTDVMTLDAAGLRRLRGGAMAMIFQEPMTALNPVFTVGAQIAEALAAHQRLDRQTVQARAVDLLASVGLPAPERQLDRYPHQFSGGQRQRIMIAMALANSPRLLIADEPTTALDVTVQADILDLIGRLRRETGTAVLLITHDLGVVSDVCDRVAVMYAGRIVEQGPVASVFAAPRHRYTRALLDTIPALNPPGSRLPAIPGQVPKPGERGRGCAFAPRCTAAVDRCVSEAPPLVPVAAEGQHWSACWRPAA